MDVRTVVIFLPFLLTSVLERREGMSEDVKLTLHIVLLFEAQGLARSQFAQLWIRHPFMVFLAESGDEKTTF